MPEAALSRADLKRGRALLWLILAAALSAAVAVVAVLGDRAAVTATSMNETMFPGFAESSTKAATIRIESPTLYVTLNKGADGKWTVADRSNYPANPEGVRALMLAMSQIKLVERRSADPARHAALELTTGEMGSGHAVTVTAADGSVLAALVAGKVQSRATGSSPGTLFVRRAGEDQTWLARGGIPIPASVGATLDKTLFTLDEARIAMVRVEPRGLAPYTLTRAAPGEPFALDAVPAGKVAQSAQILQTPASAIAGLTFDDVMKADAVELKDATTATFATFDGLVVKVTLVAGGPEGAFGLIEASVDEARAATAPPPAEGKAKADPKADAAAINARVAGWAYRLPTFVLTNLVPPLEMLVEDKPAEAPPAATPGATPGETPAPEAPPAPPH
ncbi:MAG: DUF4340 domain-containing protein [Alphaproteobacteria bacterium]